jgi:hypothetical protein
VVGPVFVELLLDLVGEPEQGQFAQSGEVSGTEVVAERRVVRTTNTRSATGFTSF